MAPRSLRRCSSSSTAKFAGEQEDLLVVSLAARRRARIQGGSRCPRPAAGCGMIPERTTAMRRSVPAGRRAVFWSDGGVPAGAGGLDGLVSVAQDRDDVPGPVLDAAGAEFRDRPAPADDVLGALLDAGEAGEKVLVAGVAVGDQVPGERGRQPGREGGFPPRGHGLQERQPPVRGPGDQHVRRPAAGLPVLLLRVRLAVLLRCRSGAVQDAGVSSAASTSSSARARASPRRTRPCRALHPCGALSTKAAETGIPSSMPMTCAARSGGTFP